MLDPGQVHVMLGLETLGTKPGAAIVSIGACGFTFASGPSRDEANRFYTRVDVESCVDAGLGVDPQTVLWWLKQSPEALEELTDQDERLPPRRALMEFLEWLGSQFPRDVLVFGNGPAFDNALLDAALEAVGLKPLPHWRARCHRTVMDMLIVQAGWEPRKVRNALKEELGPVAHNALIDAVWQAAEIRRLSEVAVAEPSRPGHQVDP